MSDINSSLIGFLKKKSLFATSPEKGLKNRERSKDKRDLLNSSKTSRNGPERTLGVFNSESTKHLKKNTSQRHIENDFHSQIDHNLSQRIESPIRYEQTNQRANFHKSDNKAIKRNFNFKNPEENSRKQPPQEEEKVTSLWTGLVNYSTTFESARIESIQCLDNMSVKIQTEVSNINYKIDVFQSKMTKILNNEFANLQEKIYSIVNKVFEESEKNIKAYIKQQEQVLAAQLISMRNDLTRDYQKIQGMREEINKPTWRKVAGELLSSELETKVEEKLVKSRAIDVGHWEIGDLGASKVVHLEQQLRDMVRLHAR